LHQIGHSAWIHTAGAGANTATLLACSGQTWSLSLARYARVSAKPLPAGRRDATPLPGGANRG